MPKIKKGEKEDNTVSNEDILKAIQYLDSSEVPCEKRILRLEDGSYVTSKE